VHWRIWNDEKHRVSGIGAHRPRPRERDPDPHLPRQGHPRSPGPGALELYRTSRRAGRPPCAWSGIPARARQSATAAPGSTTRSVACVVRPLPMKSGKTPPERSLRQGAGAGSRPSPKSEPPGAQAVGRSRRPACHRGGDARKAGGAPSVAPAALRHPRRGAALAACGEGSAPNSPSPGAPSPPPRSAGGQAVGIPRQRDPSARSIPRDGQGTEAGRAGSVDIPPDFRTRNPEERRSARAARRGDRFPRRRLRSMPGRGSASGTSR